METRRMCPHCRAFITTRDRVCPYCNESIGPRAIERRGGGAPLGGFIPHARFVTVMILVVNFGLYAATTLYSMQHSQNASAVFDIDPRTLFLFGAKYRPAIALGQWWRLVTAGFLHGGILHILMNSWVLFDLGAQVEEVYGTYRLIVVYFLATVAGFWLSNWWSPSVSVGASAGLFGLIGAMIALGVLHRSALGNAIKGLYLRWAIYGLIFGMLPGLAIDNAAHLGGLAAGFGVAYVAGLPRFEGAKSELIWRLAAYACLAITVFCFGFWAMWFVSATRQLAAGA
jgi:rhomboid protease GluP